MSKYKYHPFADIFPLMSDDEIRSLAADIVKNGLRYPILLFEGKILDGRNREKACEIAKTKPRYMTFNGDRSQALAIVWSENSERRHLTSSQKAACLAELEEHNAEILKALKADAKQRQREGGGDQKSAKAKSVTQKIEQPIERNDRSTDAILAKAQGTNRQYVADAKKVKQAAPDLHEKVKSGELKLSAAKNKLKHREKKKELESKAAAVKQMMQEQPPWLLIHDDVMAGMGSVIDHHAPARLIFADPPYNIGINYGSGPQADRLKDREYLDWVFCWMARCWDVLADDGSLWVMIGDEYAGEYAVELKKMFHIRAWIKWYETFGVNCSNNFNRTSRHIFYCVRDPKRFVFNVDAVSRPSDRQLKYKDKRANPAGKIWDDVWQIPRLTGTCDERITGVPTQLPLELVRAIVGCCSDPGDLVVDPFNGSGTTGVAAVTSGRRYIGIDNSEQFIDIANKRLEVAFHEVSRAAS